jgi:hypothetical protein
VRFIHVFWRNLTSAWDCPIRHTSTAVRYITPRPDDTIIQQIGYDATGWRSFDFWAFDVEPYELLKGPMTMAQKERTLAS